MLDEILSQLAKVLAFVSANPIAAAIFIGPAVAWVAALLFERYFMTVADTPEHRRRQQGILLIGVWLVGGAVSVALWWAFGAPLGLRARAVICYSLALLLTWVYPAIAKLATDWKPAIGSAFRRQDDNP